MSRGLGRVQRKILEILKEDDRKWLFVGDLVYRGEYPSKDFVEPTHSEQQSYWRALRKLEEYGYVETKKKPTGSMHRFDDGFRAEYVV